MIKKLVNILSVSLLTVAILLPCTALGGSGKRIVDCDGGVIVVNVALGKAVEIGFPQQVLEVMKSVEGVDDVQIKDKSIFVKVVSAEPAEVQLYVSTNQGPIYPVVVKVTAGESDMVVAVRDAARAASEKSVESQRQSRDVDPVSLIVAMARGEDVGGFERSEKKVPLKRFSMNGMVDATLVRVYKSPYYTGYIVDLKNKTVLPLQLREPDFVAPSIIAVGFSDENGYLAPTPQNAEQTKAGQYMIRVFLVAQPTSGG